MLVSCIVAFALAALTSPHTTVRAAFRAVEGDSEPAVRARWRARLARDSADRDATLGLATLDRLTYHYRDAENGYAALLRGPVDSYTTYAILGRAWAYDTHDQVLDADSAFTRARALARARHDSLAEAEAFTGLVFLRGSRDIGIGAAMVDSAQRLLPSRPDAADLRAECAFRRATLDAVLSKPTATAEALDAVALARAAGSPRAEARAWRALALVYKFRSDFDSVAIVLDRAERLQRAAHDDGELAITILRHTDIYHANGDIGAMRQWLLVAHDAAAKADARLSLGGVETSLGFTALQLNDYPTAAVRLSSALATYESIGDTGNMHTVLAYEGDLANAYGDLARARALYEGEIAFNRRLGDLSQVFEFHRALATVDARAGDLAAASRDLDSAVAVARATHHPALLPQLDLDRARIALAAGHPEPAAVLTTRYLSTLDTGDHVVRYGGRVVRAEAYALSGRLDEAARELGSAHDEIDKWRSTLADRELRVLAFQASANEINDRDAGIAVVIGALAMGGHVSEAFTLVERRRARALSDRLEQLAALRAPSISAFSTSASSTAVPSPGAPSPAAPSPAAPVPTPGAIASLPTVDSVASRLGARAALFEFVTGARGAPTTLIVIVRGQAARAYRLPSADSLAPVIDRYVGLLEAGQDPDVLSRSLGATVLGPAMAALPASVDQIIVVPDGPLHRLPFDVLRPDSTKERAPRVVDRVAVSEAPSAGALLALWRRPDPPRAARVLAFGDPSLGGAAESAGYTRLGDAGHEARLVASYSSAAVVRTGDAASAAYLEHAPLDSFSIVHFATHAIVDDRSFDRTALILAGQDGLVRPAELSALRMPADLVVLSTCRSAAGVVVDGEGVQGLTAPLLEAGARTIVATEWRIHDRAIVPFIQAFYSALARGLPVTAALRAAKLDAIARGVPPRDWAAFIDVGDPLVRVGVVAPRAASRRISLILLVAVLGAGIAFVRTQGPRSRRTQ